MNKSKTVTEKLGVAPDKVIETLKNARIGLQAKTKQTKLGKAGKLTGVSFLWLSEYLIRFIDTTFINNSVLRKSESFIKNNPWVVSYLAYFAVLFGAGVTIKGALNKIFDKNVNDKETETENIAVASPKISYISPERPDFINKAFEEYWFEIAVGLTELETYRATPAKHWGEKRYTNGLGLTWYYFINSAGNLIQTPNNKNTAARSKEDNYDQVKRHLQYETLKYLKNATIGKKNMNERYAIALVLAGYQIPSDMKHIAAGIESAKTKQDVADAFMYIGKQSKNWEEGTLKRRWVCAAYALNLINSADLLKMNRDCFSRVELNSIVRNGHFLLGPETVKYVLSMTNSNSTVENFLSDFTTGKSILAEVHSLKQDRTIDIEVFNQQDKTIEESMALVNKANYYFKHKKYESAAETYIQAIEIDPDNMDAYTLLAETYNILGAKNNSIEYYEMVTKTVVKCNTRMNANKALLYDRDVKAETYYTAGLARQAMADLYMQEDNKDLAQKNYRLAKKNFETAIYNCEKGSADINTLNKYKDSLNKADNKLENKSIAFNAGKVKIKSDVDARNSRIQALSNLDKRV